MFVSRKRITNILYISGSERALQRKRLGVRNSGRHAYGRLCAALVLRTIHVAASGIDAGQSEQREKEAAAVQRE